MVDCLSENQRFACFFVLIIATRDKSLAEQIHAKSNRPVPVMVVDSWSIADGTFVSELLRKTKWGYFFVLFLLIQRPCLRC